MNRALSRWFPGSVIIGLVAGVLVVEAVLFFDRIKVDDPVGAISVHLVNGVWGTLAVGLFHTELGLLYGGGPGQLGVQAIGVVAAGAFVIVASAVLWAIVNATLGMRVSSDEEYAGLDTTEMGMEAYPEDASSAAYRVAPGA